MTFVNNKGTTLSTDRFPVRYCFDIDETLCTGDDSHQYDKAEPYPEAVEEINRLYDAGNEIILFTARGAGSGINWHSLTIEQLARWGVKYHKLIDTGKPRYDIFVDDKATNSTDWRNSLKPKKIGFVASCFDFVHAGHCLMLKDAKTRCDTLIVALQVDPSVDRPDKNKPIMSLHERYLMLQSNRFVDRITIYRTEEDLLNLLKIFKPDVRILGNDYKHSSSKITGLEYCKEIYYHDRTNHNYSSSSIRKKVLDADCNI